ncbi:zinc finger protein 883 [Ceratitis capitata]|uniref:Zinc finger and BTB domain-containing protein 17 n=1 Tax=Ceratitis capitata TaxID=7213 RepID=W8B441_CERCA|nr:zinc finger protein 883 [Ceratitis capitata]
MGSAKICRACLSPEGRVSLLDWYQPIDYLDYILSYKECFCKCTQINLSLKNEDTETNESRSQYLCQYCAQRLTDAYDFIEKARRSDTELRSTLIEGVSLDSLANNFEWVPVKEKILDVDDSDTQLEAKCCLEDIATTSELNDNLTDGKEPSLTKDFSEEIQAGNEWDGGDLSNVSDKTFLPHKKLKIKMKKTQVKRKDGLKSNVKGDDIVTCEECKKTMMRSVLRKHKSIHKPKVFLCQSCPKTFRDSNGLKYHELIHQENRNRYPCEKCHQKFLSPYTYKRHLETHESNRKPIYKCSKCDKTFLHKNGLTIHELHHQGATLECNICQKRYVRQIDLDTHLRTHSGESPFVCHICGKSFIHKRILNRHMQYHEGYFSYTCITCGVKFSKYDQYYNHRMQHTGLPYKCGLCEKQFPDAYKIKRHIRGVHKILESNEVAKSVVKINSTKEHRGRIVEVLKNPEDEKQTQT